MGDFFRHFYSFLKWNRIFGDNRGGQDNWRSQIALHSESESSLTPRASHQMRPHFPFSSCEALKFLTHTMKTVYGAVITCLTSLPVPVCWQTMSPQTHTPARTHTHTHGLVCLEQILKHYEALGTGLTRFGVVSNGRDYLLSTLVASSLVLTTCQRIPCTISPTTPPQQRTELSTKTNKMSLLGGVRMWHAGRFVPPTSSALQLWQDVFGR